MPDYQIWLVVNCKLGAINQTLLTLDKLGHMGRLPERICSMPVKLKTMLGLNPPGKQSSHIWKCIVMCAACNSARHLISKKRGGGAT